VSRHRNEQQRLAGGVEARGIYHHVACPHCDWFAQIPRARGTWSVARRRQREHLAEKHPDAPPPARGR